MKTGILSPINNYQLPITKEGNREQGTGNREQGTNKKLKFKSLKLSQKKGCFYKESDTKKTVSLFQSHVFKHEFFLLRVASCSL